MKEGKEKRRQLPRFFKEKVKVLSDQQIQLQDQQPSLPTPLNQPSLPTPIPLNQPSLPTPIPLNQPSLPTPIPLNQPSLPTPIPLNQPSLPTPTPLNQPSLPTLIPLNQPSLPTPIPLNQPSLPTPIPLNQPSLPTPTPLHQPSLPTPIPLNQPSLPTPIPLNQPSLPTPTPLNQPSLPTPTPLNQPSLPTPQLKELKVYNPEENPHYVRAKRAAPVIQWNYIVYIQVSVSTIEIIQQIKSAVNSTSLPFPINNSTEISEIDITTVCSPNGTGVQCRCENQYRWSCDQCLSYGSCDAITSDTCGCINGIPSDGMYCQSVLQQNFTACPITTALPTTDSTVPQLLYTYMIEIELDTTDVAEINILRASLGNASYPVMVNSLTEITGVDISTVCSRNGTGVQCRCENRYRWSCDQCLSYGSCDAITSDTCRCINGIPSDGMYCQSVLQQNFTACPISTASPTTDATAFEPTTQLTTVNNATTPEPTTQLTTVTNATAFEPTTQLTTGTTNSTVPPLIYTYMIEIELDTTDVTEINTLRASLGNASYPVMVNSLTEITGVDISTVCSPNGTGVQCRCENQYRWSCDQCLSYGSCDAITSDTCGCINGIPSDGMYCQSVLQQNFTACPISTASPTTDATSPEPTTQLTPVSNATAFEPTTQLTTVNNATAFEPTTQLTTVTNATSPEPTTQLTTVNNATTPEPTTQLTTVTNATAFEPTTQLTTVTNATTPEPTTTLITVTNATTLEPTAQLTTVVFTSPEPATPTTASTPIIVTFRLNDNFTDDLNNISSTKYIKYRDDIQPVLQSRYKYYLKGYISATLTGFRDGSVIVDFTVFTTAINQTEITAANNNITTSLPSDYKVIPDSFTVIINGVPPQINNLLTESAPGTLHVADISDFVAKLNATANNLQSTITQSTASIASIVNILSNIAGISTNISVVTITNILDTVDILISNDTQGSWITLNNNSTTANTSSSLLGSLETFAAQLPGTSFNLTTQTIQLNITMFHNPFSESLNSSVVLNITNNSTGLRITTMTFSTLNNVLPARNASNDSVNDNKINGKVVLVKLNGQTNDVSLRFNKLNQSLTVNPQCVFWNFSLFDHRGGWDNNGCEFQSAGNDGTITCHCNHLTSFSILMSTSIPPDLVYVLDVITYSGVGISMASLVVCLIIEACVWKAVTRNNTSYMRHVSIVNIAVSLLIADIWFIIGASIIKTGFLNSTTTNIPACTAATFFIHFFYLALFFWMLISALLLLYRTVMVFSHMSKSIMLAIGFSVGYGAPLIIAVVTIASTAPGKGYINGEQACWLNWTKTKALLAFVIPVLAIVLINFLVLIVVLYKMLRRGVGDTSQQNDRNAAAVIARCLAILTPLFGLTWGLGVGTMVNPNDKGIQIVFALFNSLQGFFILMFGTLLDQKVRAALATRFSYIGSSSDRTRSTSSDAVAASSSTSALDHLRRRIRRNAYNVSEAATSSSSNAANESFINT
ncbi:hypothetical protein DPEC_G00085950 [Dallia pectoralis]|uniref:Uncharacterized protein n=1 Tax=Dallia pectoralis TaxID=75939 RepID=A0ACC2GZM0_DALPE|nr:hypothetical protein DPEC_G00085950 [Dallia pectoralis]